MILDKVLTNQLRNINLSIIKASVASMPISGVSRRSDFTMITLTSGVKAQKMPGEKSLREKAEKR